MAVIVGALSWVADHVLFWRRMKRERTEIEFSAARARRPTPADRWPHIYVNVRVSPYAEGRRWKVRDALKVTLTSSGGKVLEPRVFTGFPTTHNGTLDTTLEWEIDDPGPQVVLRIDPVRFTDGGSWPGQSWPLEVPAIRPDV